MTLTHILATAYLTHCLTNTIGPFGIFDRIREKFPHDSALGMFHCPWCMAGWVALVIVPIHPENLRLGFTEALATAFLGGLLSWGISYAQDATASLFSILQKNHERL